MSLNSGITAPKVSVDAALLEILGPELSLARARARGNRRIRPMPASMPLKGNGWRVRVHHRTR